MSPIQDFNLTYEALNEEGTFVEGDTVVGAVSITLTKQTTVKSLLVKLKGDASVHWSEGSGDDRRSYSAHRRYFKVKEYLVVENVKGTALPQGVHCFKFRLTIPRGDMPPSFTGLHGRIVYMLEAKMSRSWRWPSGEQIELKFLSKSFPHPGHVICPHSGSLDKEIGVFSKGQVQMSATVDRKVYSPGDTVSVVAKIHNSSSKKMRPKFCLLQKVVYRAISSTTNSYKSLDKMVGDIITMNSEETVSCQLKIPDDVIYTLHNCEILSVDYYLKVYLDISFAIDPEVMFPLVILPSSLATLQPGEAAGPYPAGAVGAPSYSDFPPPAFSAGPYAYDAYGYPTPDPAQHAHITSGYNNPGPQQPAPYGFPPAALSSSSAQHRAPTAPPLFQQEEELPTYLSLYPSSRDTYGSDHKS